MRPDLFDESKIIKKDQQLVKEPLKTEEVQKPIEIINIPIKQNDVEIKTKQPPVFVFERNKDTKQIETVNGKSNSVNTNIGLTIPNDQLQMFYYNTTKAINEIKLDIDILKSMNNDVFYIDKYTYLLKELKFLEIKKQTLEKLIK